jgi:signal transduction histidine kinase
LITTVNFIIISTPTLAWSEHELQLNLNDEYSYDSIALQEDAEKNNAVEEEPGQEDDETMRRLMVYVGIPVIVLMLVILIWIYSLRIQVDSRTLELKKEIAHRGRVHEQLRRTEKIRDRFLSVTTHELRTPLASIKSYLDIIDMEDSKSIPDSVQSHLEVVERNTARLQSLTDGILDIQRMTAKRMKLNIEPLNFREIIDNSVSEIKPLIGEKKQKFNLRIPNKPLMINGDEIRLSQVMTNLLGNAQKFTPEGGNIALQITDKKSYFEVRVTDSGIGIRKDDMERIFEPFAAIKKKVYVKGTGLGLSVTKGLVNEHGGKIWAESPGLGKGSTFTFTLPKLKSTKVKKKGG